MLKYENYFFNYIKTHLLTKVECEIVLHNNEKYIVLHFARRKENDEKG